MKQSKMKQSKQFILLFALLGIGKLSIAQFTTTSGNITQTSSGNVGIGFPAFTPARTLHVQTGVQNGGIRVTQTYNGFSALELFNSTLNAHNWAVVSTGNGNSEGAGNFGLYDYTTGLYRMFIYGTSGNTGFGTKTPITKLHINGNALFTNIAGVPSSAAFIRGNSNYSTATDPEYTWYNNDQTGLFHPAINIIGFTIGGSERMRINENGNVGIGTANPLAKLDVTNGSILFNGTTGTTPASGAGTRMMWIPSKSAFRVGTVDGTHWDDANIGTASTAFGLMTTAPSYGSFVIGRYNYNLGAFNPTTWISTDPLFVVGNGSRDQLSNALTVYKDGKTLIGNPGLANFKGTPDGYKLYVQEGILTDRVKVAVNTSNNWADYVFDENYKLKSINELEAFVKTHKHLPNVPSADEVVKDGIDMATMDAKLLEKIEELSLYIIEQNKRIEALESKTKELSK